MRRAREVGAHAGKFPACVGTFLARHGNRVGRSLGGFTTRFVSGHDTPESLLSAALVNSCYHEDGGSWDSRTS